MLSLRSKIVLSFSVIVLTGTILMVTIINFTTRYGYQDFTKKNDIIFAQRLIKPLEEFYAKNGTWNYVEDFLVFPKPRMGEMMDGRGRNPYPPVLLTDKNGKVLVSTQNFNKLKLSKDQLEKAYPVVYENRQVGFLLTGSMIVSALTQEEENFLSDIRNIIILVSLFILVLSIIFAYYFSSRLTKPIRDLSTATKNIENGNYSSRVEIQGTDEISKLSESFNKMAKSIENSDTWRKQIIADSAHELRTPVTLIQGNLEMILDGVYEPDEKHINNIYEETLVLSRLIKELQELSSAESGVMKLNKTDTDITFLVNNIIDIFNAEIVKKNITVINNLNNKVLSIVNNKNPKIEGDYDKLKQVFSNIFTNSIRNTPNGGEIEISSEITNDFLTIKIKDTGCGIPQEDLEKVFERFYRTDSSRNRESGGRGLGLAICKEIIKLHNGTIKAESQKYFGTTIIVTLPIYDIKTL